MQRMFSPWRSQYVATFKHPPKRRKKRQSLFTAALRAGDDEKQLIVWRAAHCFVIMNRYPYNSGHLMVVPYRETADIHALEPAELADIMAAVQRSMRALDAVMQPDGYNFGANLGRSGGAGIDDHIHFHVVPRWNGDTNFMPVLADTKVVSEEMRKTLKNLRKAFSGRGRRA